MGGVGPLGRYGRLLEVSDNTRVKSRLEGSGERNLSRRSREAGKCPDRWGRYEVNQDSAGPLSQLR